LLGSLLKPLLTEGVLVYTITITTNLNKKISIMNKNNENTSASEEEEVTINSSKNENIDNTDITSSTSEESVPKTDKPVPSGSTVNSPEKDQELLTSFTDTPTTTSTKSGSRKYMRGAVLILVLVLIAGGAFAYFAHKHHQKEVKAAQASLIQHLTVGIEAGDLGTTFYPNAGNSAGSSLLYSQVFDGLVQYENQNQIVPDLASGWTTPNNTTWLFTIKNGIKFHDGHTLTASDVTYSLNLLKSKGNNNDYAENFVTTLKSVQTVNSNMVKIVTSQPDPVLLNKLAFLYVVDPNLPKGDNPSMAGTGPYELKPGTNLTNSKVQLVAYNGFHGGQVDTKAVTIDNVPSYSQLLSGFKNHEYNIVGQVPSSESKQPNSYTFDEQDDSVDFLAFNTTTGPLSNKLVREAIQDAINPVTMAQEGSGAKVIAINQLIPPSIPGYNPAIKANSQNLAQARQLLAEAGYSKGLTLNLVTSTDTSNNKPLTEQLAQVGITLTTTVLPSLNDLVNAYLAGENQITLLAYSSSTLDGADVLGSTLIPANYSNTQLYNLINQATTTIDPASRLKLLQQAETIVSANVPVVPLYYNDNIYLMDKPYVLHQDLPALYISVYFNKVHLKE
jgi:peptide/nickel transport system substrate-binding protein